MRRLLRTLCVGTAGCVVLACGRHRSTASTSAATDTSANGLLDTGALKLAPGTDTAGLSRDIAAANAGTTTTTTAAGSTTPTVAPATKSTARAASVPHHSTAPKTAAAVPHHSAKMSHATAAHNKSAHARHAPVTIASLSRNHSRVRSLQSALNRDGCHAGPVDGVVGPRTRRAIACGEKKHHVRSGDLGGLMVKLRI